MKKRISDVFNETANALSGTDPDQIRRQLLERLAKYRAFLSAFLGCKLAAEDKPFLIPTRTKADKNNLHVKKFTFGKLLTLM